MTRCRIDRVRPEDVANYRLQGMTYKQIAERLGVKKTTIARRWNEYLNPNHTEEPKIFKSYADYMYVERRNSIIKAAENHCNLLNCKTKAEWDKAFHRYMDEKAYETGITHIKPVKR